MTDQTKAPELPLYVMIWERVDFENGGHLPRGWISSFAADLHPHHYVRADIAAEQVQEAYERAAQILDNYGKRYFRADDADIEALANAIRDLKSDDTNEAAAPTPAPDAVARLVEAAQALGAMPEGYCFCSANRVGDDSKSHEPECADLRAALAAMEASHE